MSNRMWITVLALALGGCSLDQPPDQNPVSADPDGPTFVVKQRLCSNAWIQVSAGYEHTCGITEDGAVWCWGRGDRGQLGNGYTNDYSTPSAVFVPGVNATKVSAKGSHSCVILDYPTTGNLWCWGSNLKREVGQPTGDFYSSPQRVMHANIVEPVKDVAVGVGNTCVIDANDSLLCWGDQAYCQTGTLSATPTPTPTMAPSMYLFDRWPGMVKQMSVQGGTICGVSTLDSARCWGRNLYRNLGNDSSASYTCSPAVPSVSFSSDVGHVTAGSAFTCWTDVTSVNLPHCVGFNAYSQLGLGYSTPTSPYYVATPSPLDDTNIPSNIVQIEAGYGLNAIALDASGYVYTWGYGLYGSLGNGTYGERSTPDKVYSGGNPLIAVQVSAGADHNCALKSDGEILCWGWNAHGQLGDNSTTNRNTPAAVPCR